MPFFEISTTKYNEDFKLIQVIMTKMASSCNITAGFKFGEPTPRFGWTFFQMLIDQELYIGINDEFSDKNPYPGCTACAPVISQAAIIE